MAKGSGGGGRAGGNPATKAANATIDKMGRATGGETRQVAGQRINSADVVNQSLDAAKKMPVDLNAARETVNLRVYGSKSPSAEQLERYDRVLGRKPPSEATIVRLANERRILKAIGEITGSNATGQEGKWDFSSADTIHRDFNKYLWRRVHGIRQRWSSSHQ
jgi:hypothetical protein